MPALQLTESSWVKIGLAIYLVDQSPLFGFGFETITNSMMVIRVSKSGLCLHPLQPGQTRILRHQRRLWGHWLYIAALRLEDGSLLVVATQTAPKSAITDYAKRWGIETLFGIFKTRGFCLESTHLMDSERLSKLVALLSLALCWVILTGQWLHRLKPLALKKHGRRAKSIFRYGFDYLRNIVLNLEQKRDDFLDVLQFLSCT